MLTNSSSSVLTKKSDQIIVKLCLIFFVEFRFCISIMKLKHIHEFISDSVDGIVDNRDMHKSKSKTIQSSYLLNTTCTHPHQFSIRLCQSNFWKHVTKIINNFGVSVATCNNMHITHESCGVHSHTSHIPKNQFWVFQCLVLDFYMFRTGIWSSTFRPS